MPQDKSSTKGLQITLRRQLAHSKTPLREPDHLVIFNLPAGSRTIIGRRSSKEKGMTTSNAPCGRVDVDSPVVSRRHAEISVEHNGDKEAQAFVKDCNSTHGTRLNGLLLDAGRKHLMKSNDTLQVGSTVERHLQMFAPPSYTIETRPMLNDMEHEQSCTDSPRGWRSSAQESHPHTVLPPIDSSNNWDFPQTGSFSGSYWKPKPWSTSEGDKELLRYDFNLGRMPHQAEMLTYGSAGQGSYPPQSLLPAIPKPECAEAQQSAKSVEGGVDSEDVSVNVKPGNPSGLPSDVMSLTFEELCSDDESDLDDDSEGDESDYAESEIVEVLNKISEKSQCSGTDSEQKASSTNQTQQHAQVSFTAELDSLDCDDDNEIAEVCQNNERQSNESAPNHGVELLVPQKPTIPREVDDGAVSRDEPIADGSTREGAILVIEDSVPTEKSIHQADAAPPKTGISVEDIIHIDVEPTFNQAPQKSEAKECPIQELLRPVSSPYGACEKKEESTQSRKRKLDDFLADLEDEEVPSHTDSRKDVDVASAPNHTQVGPVTVTETNSNRSKRAKSLRVAATLVSLGAAFIAALAIPPEGFYD